LKVIGNAVSSTNAEIRTITLHILPPVFFKSNTLAIPSQTLFEQSEAVVGGFLEAWTNRVGDPVISKWIVVVLCVSMSLNARLLSAARRGAMQPTVNTPKAVPNKEAPSKPETAPSPPSISIGTENRASSATSFRLDESESDDEEKRLAAVQKSTRRIRSLSECMQILTEGRPSELLDEEVIALAIQKKIPLYALEKTLKDLERAVKVRRAVVCKISVRLVY